MSSSVVFDVLIKLLEQVYLLYNERVQRISRYNKAKQLNKIESFKI
jgi:hypothetical protein